MLTNARKNICSRFDWRLICRCYPCEDGFIKAESIGSLNVESLFWTLWQRKLKEGTSPADENIRMLRANLENTVCAILETRDGRELARTSWPGNGEILLHSDPLRFPLLSNLDLVSYDVLGPGDMYQLVAELETTIRGWSDPEVIKGLTELIRLCERCADSADLLLSFSPVDSESDRNFLY